MYGQHSYNEIVGKLAKLAEQSIKSAVSEVKAIPKYPTSREETSSHQHGAEHILIS